MNAIRSRRGFLAGLSTGAACVAASPVAFAVPAPTSDVSLSGLSAGPARGDDADLFKLLEDHRAAAAKERQLYKAYEKFEAKRFQQQRVLEQQIPEVLRRRPEDLELGLPEPASADDGFYGDSSEVDRLRGKTWKRRESSEDGERGSFVVRPSSAARTRADEVIAAFDTWQKRRDRRPRGYRAAERAMDAAGRRLCDLERKICSSRARTLAGVIAKARMGREVGDEDRFGAALITDLLALADKVDGRNPSPMPSGHRITSNFSRNT
jgi:hypothetical protein